MPLPPKPSPSQVSLLDSTARRSNSTTPGPRPVSVAVEFVHNIPYLPVGAELPALPPDDGAPSVSLAGESTLGGTTSMGRSATPQASTAATQMGHGGLLMTHVHPATVLNTVCVTVVRAARGVPGDAARDATARFLAQRRARWLFAWWCAAHTPATLQTCLLHLLERLDPSGCAAALAEPVTAADPSSVAARDLVEGQPVLRTHVEMHQARDRCAVLVLDHMLDAAILVDFLARTKAPRWGLHILVFDDASAPVVGPEALQELAPLCHTELVSFEPAPEVLAIAAQHAVADARCHIADVDPDTFRDGEDFEERMMRTERLCNLVAGSPTLATAVHCLKRHVFAAADTYDVIDAAEGMRRDIDRAGVVAGPPPRRRCMLRPERSVAVASGAGGLLGTVIELCPAEHSAALAALRMSASLPPLFPQQLFTEAVVDTVVAWGVWQRCGDLVHVPTDVRAGLAAYYAFLATKIEDAPTPPVSIGGARDSPLAQVFSLTADWLLAVARRAPRWWRHWSTLTARHVVDEARALRLVVPRLEGLQEPLKTTAYLPVSYDTLPLPQDPEDWTSRHIEALAVRAAAMAQRERHADVALTLEKELAVCMHEARRLVDTERGVPHALLASVFCLYIALSQSHLDGSRGGVGEEYAALAQSLATSMTNSRRDTPARGVAALLRGQVAVRLADAEGRRAVATRQSRILCDDPDADMNVHAQVRAEVEQTALITEASGCYEEASTALHAAPSGLMGDDLASCQVTISQAMTADLRDREALRAAAKGFELTQSSRRVTETAVSRQPRLSEMSTRAELAWGQEHLPDLLAAIEQHDYATAHALISRCDVVVYLGRLVPVGAHASVRTSSTGAPPPLIIAQGRRAEKFVQASLPPPIYYEHLQCHACVAKQEVASHHGLDWRREQRQDSRVCYEFPAHTLICTCGDSDVAAVELLRRMLDAGLDPRVCSPHDMHTLLHAAVARNLFLVTGLLLSHEGVSVEYTAPHRLEARRVGLRTTAHVVERPNPLPIPLVTCTDALTMEQLLLRGREPQAALARNRRVALAALSQIPARLPALFEPGAPLAAEVVPMLLQADALPKQREAIAPFCPLDEVIGVLDGIDDADLARALLRRFFLGHSRVNMQEEDRDPFRPPTPDAGSNKFDAGPPRLVLVVLHGLAREKRTALARAAEGAVRRGLMECAAVMVEEFGAELDLMASWEMAAEYTKARRAKRNAQLQNGLNFMQTSSDSSVSSEAPDSRESDSGETTAPPTPPRGRFLAPPL